MTEVCGAKIEYLSPADIRKLSVVQVTEANAFGHLQASPLPGGLYDLKMGPVNRGDVCKTCSLTSECPGHMGHIELISETYNPFLVRRMLQLLKKMCDKCHRFRISATLTERIVETFKLIHGGHETSESQMTMHLVDEASRASIEKEALVNGSGAKTEMAWLDASNDAVWLEEGTKTKAEIDMVSRRLKVIFGDAQRRLNHELTSMEPEAVNAGSTATTGEFQAMLAKIDSFFASIPVSRCENCGTACGGYRIDGYSKIFAKPRGGKQSEEKFLTPTAVRSQLRKLWKAEKNILRFLVPGAGAQREGIFFLTALAVPPNRFRPLRAVGGGSPGAQMYLPQSTMALKAVIEANALVQKELTEGQGKAGAAIVALQDAVNAYMDSSRNPRAANPDAIKFGVRQVLERKQGLFRMKMMGKRVNYAARSVISPDVSLETNQIGIPMFIAMQLTVPEPVNTHNADYLRTLVENGPDIFPGARSVESDGRTISLIGRTRAQRQAIAATLLLPGLSTTGKIVHRQLRNGDPLLVNRQPTLHKPGIMALQVRVLKKEKTIRMHYANCNTFNADFDGDEINLHCPQDPVARAEALHVASADRQFLGPTAGQPLRGLIQDHVVGGTTLTARDTFLARDQVQQLLYISIRAALHEDVAGNLSAPGSGGSRAIERLNLSDFRLNLPRPAILKPQPLWTGKQVITCFLHALIPGGGISIDAKSRTQGDLWGGVLDGNKEEEVVVIRDSELLQGVLDKNAFGNANGGLTHTIYELLGPKVAGLLLTGFSRLFTLYLQSRGFTCALGDLLVKSGSEAARQELLRSATIGAWKKLDLWLTEEAGVKAGETDHMGEVAGEVVKKSKGAKNTSALGRLEALMLGNSSEFWGKCIDAILPKGQLVPFPENSFSAMVNTGAKGSKVNHSQICCLLGQQELEGHRVPLLSTFKTLPAFAPFDFSARAGGFISDRFLSGIRPQEFFFHCMAGREGLIDTAVKTARSGYLQRCLVKHLECLTVNYDHTIRDADNAVVQFAYGEDGVDVTKSSYLGRLGVLAQNKRFLTRVDPARNSGFDDDLAAAYVNLARKPNSSRRQAALMEKLASSNLTEADKRHLEISVEAGAQDPCASVLSPAQNLGAVSELHAKRIDDFLKSCKNAEEAAELTELFNLKFMRALADPGEAVGTLAAQGMGEPSTQMTLNTFHLAGHGGANVTLGIPRLREIVQTASRKICTPSMNIPCAVETAKRVQAELERVPLREVVTATHVSEKVLVDDAGEKLRIYELVMDLTDLADLQEVYPGLSIDAVAKFLDREFRAKLDTQVKKLIRSSNNSMDVKVQKAINDITGNTSGRVAAAREDGDDDDEPQSSRNPIDDAEPVEDDRADDNDEDDASEGQYDSDSDASSASSDSAASSALVKKDESSDDSSDGEDRPSKIFRSTGAVGDSVAVREALAVQKTGTDEVFCLPGQLHGNRFIVRSRDLRLSERVSRKILILEVVEELCNSMYLQLAPGITRVIVGDKGLDTEGVNLDIFWQMHDINHTKINTNDIALMLDRYGVESCRLSIVNEISRVFGHYGISVDRRHLSLIADYMTHQGGYRPFNRAGMNAHSSPFLKMTFETSVNFLTAASMDAQPDRLQSPAAALILGKLAPIGTGVFGLRTDWEAKQPAMLEGDVKHFTFCEEE